MGIHIHFCTGLVHRELTLREILTKISEGKVSPNFGSNWSEKRDNPCQDGLRDGVVHCSISKEQGAYNYTLKLFGLKTDHDFIDNDPLFNEKREVCLNDGGWLQP